MNLPSQGETNGFITGSGRTSLKFHIQEKMCNGGLGAGEFDSSNIHGSKQLLSGNLRGLFL